jgi:glucokinase
LANSHLGENLLPQNAGRFQYGMPNYLGVEIGGTKLQVVAGDESGTILDRRRFRVDPAGGPAGIRQQIESGLKELQASYRPIAVGVGFGGPVHWREGRIAKSHQVEGWSGFALRDWTEKTSGLPARVENDSNLAALAESRCGAGRGFSPVFYFNLGSGVGGGLTLDGRIFHGRPPGESEFGHLRLDREGTIVEQRCSGWAIDRRIREASIRDPASLLASRLDGPPGGESQHLRAAWDLGDPLAHQILDELAADLGFALSHVVHLLHPGVLVLGGGLSLIGEPLRAAITKGLQPHLMEVFRPGPELRLATVGEDAVPTGALLLAAEAKAAPR